MGKISNDTLRPKGKKNSAWKCFMALCLFCLTGELLKDTNSECNKAKGGSRDIFTGSLSRISDSNCSQMCPKSGHLSYSNILCFQPRFYLRDREQIAGTGVPGCAEGLLIPAFM